jgi:hypothetical protein
MTNRPSYPNEGKPKIDEADNTEMYACPRFESCSANMCPKDRHIDYRTWYPLEDVCPLAEYRHLPYIRRQRQINKHQPKSLMHMDYPLTFDYLVRTAPKKRTLSPEHKAKLLPSSKRHQFGPKPSSENRDFHSGMQGKVILWVEGKHKGKRQSQC